MALELSQEQRLLVEQTPNLGVVGVEYYRSKVYSDKLIDGLKNTNLFTEVDYQDALSGEPDFIATVQRQVYGSAVIPLVPFLTLGLVPLSMEEEHGNVFSLQPVDTTKAPLTIDCTFSGDSNLGWISGFLNLSPDRTSRTPVKTPRYYDQISYHIARVVNE